MLAKGFRPFFLAGALFAIGIVPAWLLVLSGRLAAPPYFDPTSWHAHEMIFGFGAAIIAGFLLTAVGNWTQRETAVGGALAGLVALWALGRLAFAASMGVPHWLVAVIDLAFLPALAIAVGRPIVLARNRRNAVMLIALLALWIANLVMHLDALGVLSSASRSAALVGVDVIMLFMVIIGGRVIPMFTRNATGGATIRSHARLDVAATLAVVMVMVFDALPSLATTPVRCAVLGLAAVAVAARTVHWGARRSLDVPLLWILHFGHAWIPIGLGLRALALVSVSVPASVGLHAITAGAVGSLTLGMMARVALGHTGRALVPPAHVAWAFGLITAAAVARVGVPLLRPDAYMAGLVASAVLWALAFGIYLVAYAPILTAPRADGKPG